MEVQVLQRAMDILEVIGKNAAPLALKTIAAETGLPKSTVYRLLSNLEKRQYVSCDSDGAYRLGLKLLMLSSYAEQNFSIKRLARPYMMRLNELTRETVHLGVLHKKAVLYVDAVESPQTIRLAARVGSTNMLHCTALGKALLLKHSDDAIRQYLEEQGMERRTQHTICTPDAFLREMEQVRRLGYSLDDRESETESSCIGAPIYNHRGEVAAAISISGPASRVTREKLEKVFAPALLAQMKELWAAMGFSGNGKA